MEYKELNGIKLLSLWGMNVAVSKYGKYYKQVLVLGLPILLGQLGVIITGFVDTIMVGQYATDALAAASFVNSLFNLMNIVCLGFSYGLTPIVGAYYGKGETARIGEAVKAGLVLNVIFGIFCMGLMLLCYVFLDEMGQPEELLPLMRPYYIVILLSMLPVVIVNVSRQFTDAITDTKVAMVILLSGNALNIFGNWLLIYGNWGCPEWGLYGAGVSTLIARVLMLVAYCLCLLKFSRYKEYLRGFIAGIVSLKDLKLIGKLSLPVSMQMGMETAIFTFATVLVGWLGAEYLAAYQVILALGTIGFMVYYSFGASLSIMVANYSGVNDTVQVRRSAAAGYHVILASAVLASLLVLLGGKGILGLFTPDEIVVNIAYSLIIPWIVYQFGDATQVAYANALRGIKCVMPVMKFAFIAYVVIGLPAAFLFAFPFKGGIIGIYLSFAVALFVAGVLFMQCFYKEISRKG